MDLYTIIKFLHILTAVAWVGGAILLFVASEVAQRSPGPVFGGFSAIAAQLGNLFFIPVALSTLVLGIILTVMSWSFADLWIILALAGIATSIAFGIVIIKPTTDRIAGIARTEGPDSPQVRALSAGLLHKGRFDLVLMVVIVADMVFKPGLWRRGDAVDHGGGIGRRYPGVSGAAAAIVGAWRLRPQLAQA